MDADAEKFNSATLVDATKITAVGLVLGRVTLRRSLHTVQFALLFPVNAAAGSLFKSGRLVSVSNSRMSSYPVIQYSSNRQGTLRDICSDA